MANIRFNQDTSLNTDGQAAADQPQGQLHREAVRSQPTKTMGVRNQNQRVEDSEKTTGYRSADLTSGGAEFIHGAATGAANVVPRKHLKEL